MKTLILAGGGNATQSFETDEYFCSLLPATPRIAYIPVAINLVKHPLNECVAWLSEGLSRFCKPHIITVTSAAEMPSLSDIDAIYIGGGNTFKLLQFLLDAGFAAYLKDAFDAGKIIYGGSAGAIVFGQSIDSAAHDDKNEVGLTNTDGLNFVPFDIWCHYKGEAIAKEYAVQRKTICIPEESAVVYDGTSCTCLGKSQVLVMHKDQTESLRPLIAQVFQRFTYLRIFNNLSNDFL